MARTVNIFSVSHLATSSLATKQYCPVALDSADGIIVPASDGDQCIGVLQEKPGAGQTGAVMVVGISKALVGSGGVTAGQAVHALNAGGVVAATSGKFILGIALDTAASGDYTSVLLLPGGKV